MSGYEYRMYLIRWPVYCVL